MMTLLKKAECHILTACLLMAVLLPAHTKELCVLSVKMS